MNHKEEMKSSKQLRVKTSNKTVSVPVALTKPTSTQKPHITGNPYKGPNSPMKVRHREYILDVISDTDSSVFVNRQLPIQPGLSTVFPWLSTIAARFESYRFNRLRFIYEPVVPTTSSGSVMMAIDFDASDSAATSKVQLMSYHNAVRIAPWSQTHYESDQGDLWKFGTQRYIRTSPTAGDIKTYDVGTFQIATQGVSVLGTNDPQVLGELYVEYDVDFYTPQIESGTIQSTASLVCSGAGGPVFGNVVINSSSMDLVSIPSITQLSINRPGTYLLTGYSSTGTLTQMGVVTYSSNIILLENVLTNSTTNTSMLLRIPPSTGPGIIKMTGSLNAGQLTFRLTSWNSPLQ
jgi:hypothetical protein